MIVLRHNKGFSLVEVMFSVVIGLIVMGMMSLLYVGANNSMVVGISLAEINSDGRIAMDRIVRDVRRATDIETNRTISGTTYVTGNDELVIEVPAIDANSDVLDGVFDYVVYVLDSEDETRIRQIIDPDASSSRASRDQIIAENIESFALSSEGTGLASVGSLSAVTTLQIPLIVSKTPLQNKTVSQTLNSDVELRNN